MNKLYNETIIILFITILSYISAWGYDYGYFSFYSIPSEFITINLSKLINPFKILLMLFFFILMIYVLFLDLKNKSSMKGILLTCVLLFITGFSFFYFIKEIKLTIDIYFLLSFVSLMIFVFFKSIKLPIRIIDQQNKIKELKELINNAILVKPEKKNKSNKTKKETSNTTTSEMKEDIINIEELISKLYKTVIIAPYIVLLLLTYSVVLLFQEFGHNKAESKTSFLTYGDQIVMDITGDRCLLVDFDRNSNKISNKYTIFNLSDNKNYKLKLENITLQIMK